MGSVRSVILVSDSLDVNVGGSAPESDVMVMAATARLQKWVLV